ncbi:MAG: hypothetical protein Q4D85_09890 [Corynebacterium sp.]|uniref:hypothetical protein n=1 Tax=Corynebacterium sp. TaxID=1720 RepID=UPI0026DB48A8|nr:hypothetical protein [Corynebacterium sp.]MDO5099054.1 hypothetical protein [Corynebacterium sp.]
MKKSLGRCALITAVVTALQLPIPAAAAVAPVNQGDLITLSDDRGHSRCTAGYIDTANLRIWTAGHCAEDRAHAFNQFGDHIGQFRHRYSIKDKSLTAEDEETRRQAKLRYQFYDIGYINLRKPEFGGTNSYSGDRPYIPEVGEEICRFGATTRAVYCGVVLRVSEHLIYAIDLRSDRGDSGGPNWVPGKGYVGQTLGINRIRNSQGRSAVTTVIHREDLNRQVVPLPDDVPTPRLQPPYEELVASESTIRNKLEVFGADMPSPSELSGILRNHEKALTEAQERTKLAENNLAKAIEDLDLKNKNEAEYLKQIEKLQEEKAAAQKELAEIKAMTDMAGLNAKDKEIAELNDQLKNQKSFHAIITAVISLAIAVLAGVGGWLAHMLSANGIIRI